MKKQAKAQVIGSYIYVITNEAILPTDYFVDKDDVRQTHSTNGNTILSTMASLHPVNTSRRVIGTNNPSLDFLPNLSPHIIQLLKLLGKDTADVTVEYIEGIIIDPPNGAVYGFPKYIQNKTELENIYTTLINLGYPKEIEFSQSDVDVRVVSQPYISMGNLVVNAFEGNIISNWWDNLHINVKWDYFHLLKRINNNLELDTPYNLEPNLIQSLYHIINT